MIRDSGRAEMAVSGPHPVPDPIETPEYHGAEGDPRYPAPRDLRKAISSVIDFTLIMIITPAVGVTVALLSGTGIDKTTAFLFWTLMPLQLIALPAWTGATLGQHLCGLTQIRGTDGLRPGFRDVIGAGDNLPTEIRRRGDLYVNFAGLVVVRRCDVAGPNRQIRQALQAVVAVSSWRCRTRRRALNNEL